MMAPGPTGIQPTPGSTTPDNGLARAQDSLLLLPGMRFLRSLVALDDLLRRYAHRQYAEQLVLQGSGRTAIAEKSPMSVMPGDAGQRLGWAGSPIGAWTAFPYSG